MGKVEAAINVPRNALREGLLPSSVAIVSSESDERWVQDLQDLKLITFPLDQVEGRPFKVKLIDFRNEKRTQSNIVIFER